MLDSLNRSCKQKYCYWQLLVVHGDIYISQPLWTWKYMMWHLTEFLRTERQHEEPLALPGLNGPRAAWYMWCTLIIISGLGLVWYLLCMKVASDLLLSYCVWCHAWCNWSRKNRIKKKGSVKSVWPMRRHRRRSVLTFSSNQLHDPSCIRFPRWEQRS